MQEVSVGLEAGGYRLEAVLVEEWMSSIWRVVHIQQQAPFLLKRLRSGLAKDANIHQQFLSETQLQRVVQHPHIIPVVDVVDTPAVTGLIMPWMAGENLADHLHRCAPLPPPQAIRWCQQLLSALSVLHSHGICYRHLKPAEIILCDGVLQVDVQTPRSDRLFRQTTSRNDEFYAYMSPEESTTIDSDHRVDIFSVGAILFEMLTGRYAFDGTTGDVLTTIRSGVAPALGDHRADLPASLADVVACALAFDPADRFATAAAFSQALGVVA